MTQDIAIEHTTLHHRVCYADTDAGGIVYHGRFLEMGERARNKLMNGAGFTFAMLADQYRVMLVIHRVEVVYHAPALLEDDLQVKTRLATCRPSRSVWISDVMRQGSLLASITIEVVALDTLTRQLAPHPEPFLERLRPYLADGPRKSDVTHSGG